MLTPRMFLEQLMKMDPGDLDSPLVILGYPDPNNGHTKQFIPVDLESIFNPTGDCGEYHGNLVDMYLVEIEATITPGQ